MRKKLTKPAPGTPISSSLICDIIDELESLRLIETPGVRFGRTPRGTLVFVDAANPARNSYKETPGCFEIRKKGTKIEDGQEEEDVGGFDNCYFMIGGKLYECERAKDFGFDNMKNVFVYVKVDMTENSVEPYVNTAESFSEMRNEALDEDIYITPLYKFGDEEGVVEVDFRKMPMAISGEFAL